MGNQASKKRTSGSRLDKEIAVLKANSKLSEQEIREMYDEFNYEAESGTGRMNKRQFLKFYKQVTGTDDENSVLADNAFAVFDTNHDGSIDFSEFVLASTVGNKNGLDSQLQLAFDIIDTSGDEHISYDEMINFINKAVKLTTGDKSTSVNSDMIATHVFNTFNIDKEHKLNEKQFIDGCKTNKDLAKIFGIL